jgi:ABC-type branched-subunit amino acid transport system ATPase component
MTQPVLEARRLVKSFGGIRATDNLSLTVARGDRPQRCGQNDTDYTALWILVARCR